MELGNGEFNNFFNKTKEDKYFVENFQVNEKDTNSHIALLVERIEKKSIVLDVGCAQGKYGTYLKDAKDCTIFGIDIIEAAVNYVKGIGKYQDVFLLDIENIKDNSEEYNRFKSSVKDVDYILLSNVLEHFSDPTKVLRMLGELLKVGGKILVSVPNIGYADIYLNLMNGKFNYTDEGILDNTHMKFFTKSSFVEWIEDMNEYYKGYNLECEYLGGTFHYNEFLNRIKKEKKELFNILERNPDFNILQILFELTKQDEGVVTPRLKSLLEQKPVDMLEEINSAIMGQTKNSKVEINNNERQWYENKLQELETANHWSSERVKELESVNEEADCYIRKLEKRDKESMAWIEETKEANKEVTQYINALEKDKQETAKWIEETKEANKEVTQYINALEKDKQETTKWIKETKEANKQAAEYIGKLEVEKTELIKYIENQEKDKAKAIDYITVLEKEKNTRNIYIEKVEKDNRQASEYINVLEQQIEKVHKEATNRINMLEKEKKETIGHINALENIDKEKDNKIEQLKLQIEKKEQEINLLKTRLIYKIQNKIKRFLKKNKSN